MLYALAHFPELEDEFFQQFRNQYDPYAVLIDAHITLIFPVPDSIQKDSLFNHIENVINNWHAFDVTISGYYKSFDHWLMLSLKEGNEKVIRLHDDFYTGILQPFLREDLPFTPHVGLGYFGTKPYDFHHPTTVIPLNAEKYTKALAELSEEELVFRKTINSLTFLEINDSFNTFNKIKTFQF